MSTDSRGNPYILAGRYDSIPVSECKGILDSIEACIEKYYRGNDKKLACLRREALIHRMDNA